MCATLEHLEFGLTWQCPFNDNIDISTSKADNFFKFWYLNNHFIYFLNNENN
jgi:hypothetical protein